MKEIFTPDIRDSLNEASVVLDRFLARHIQANTTDDPGEVRMTLAGDITPVMTSSGEQIVGKNESIPPRRESMETRGSTVPAGTSIPNISTLQSASEAAPQRMVALTRFVTKIKQKMSGVLSLFRR
jgi:hypothetical protein